MRWFFCIGLITPYDSASALSDLEQTGNYHSNESQPPRAFPYPAGVFGLRASHTDTQIPDLRLTKPNLQDLGKKPSPLTLETTGDGTLSRNPSRQRPSGTNTDASGFRQYQRGPQPRLNLIHWVLGHNLRTGNKSRNESQINLEETVSEDPSIPKNSSHIGPTNENQPGRAEPLNPQPNGMAFP